jgi:hypothetical protein
MGRPLKIKESATVDIGFNNPAGGKYYGVVGGDTALSTVTSPVTKIRVKISGESEADGFILRQKGSSSYLVEDASGNTGVCTLEDEADASLNDGGMTVSVILPDSSIVRLKRFSNKFGILFDDTRVLLNFFDISDDTVEKSGAEGSTTTIDLAQVDNPSIWG